MFLLYEEAESQKFAKQNNEGKNLDSEYNGTLAIIDFEILFFQSPKVYKICGGRILKWK